MLYIASGLQNRARIIDLIDKFESLGISISYNWCSHGQVFNLDQLRAIAQNEINGVLNAKCILVVMPGGRGTHYEMGVAWAMKKPIVMLIEDINKHQWTSFHMLPEIIIVHTEDEAISLVEKILKDGFTHLNHSNICKS